jgi:hypothetical protein
VPEPCAEAASLHDVQKPHEQDDPDHNIDNSLDDRWDSWDLVNTPQDQADDAKDDEGSEK